ncbi:barstar family protein [Proteus hauseri]|uniref:barstar family protein n=1 Tax=Proteus hauseri TaxID=183417 RepID=UPI00100953D1|nr:barstar family protein [Proteus hauseri]QAV23577.1 ribonuclease inhibitor [Proteus hauseri]
MQKIIFDFARLPNMEAFYLSFAKQFDLPNYFGNNLDALWDVLTGEIALPVQVVFKHFPQYSPVFQPLIVLMQETQIELGDALFQFICEE